VIYHEIIYDVVMKKTPPPRCPLLKGQGGNVPALRRLCIPLSAVTVSLHYLPRYLRSTVTCGKTPTSYCYAMKTNSRKIRSQVWQPTSAGKGADMSELQAHHCMTPEQ